MSTAMITPGQVGRDAARAAKRALTAARMEDAAHLLSFGVDPEEAARRAGWPSITAAARATHRAGNLELARQFERIHGQHRRAARQATRRTA